MSRLNIGMDPDVRGHLETMLRIVNNQRCQKGLAPVTMRTVVHDIIKRVAAMDTVFLAGELLKKES